MATEELRFQDGVTEGLDVGGEALVGRSCAVCSGDDVAVLEAPQIFAGSSYGNVLVNSLQLPHIYQSLYELRAVSIWSH